MKNYSVACILSDGTSVPAFSFSVPDGPKGDTGNTGEVGNSGDTGVGWTYGATVPSVSVGRAGESFFLTGTAQVYVSNSSGTYVSSYSLKGPTGNTGSAGAYPSSATITAV